MECPIKLDKVHCQNCAFSKEGLCDYPYRVAEIRDKQKEQGKDEQNKN